MKTRYLLPCSCGQEIPVETGQAGQLVACACGNQQEVPALLRMSALKRAPEADVAPSKPAGRWGLRQRLLVVGAVVTLLFLTLSLLGYWSRPHLESVFTHRPLKTLTYTGVWEIWQDLGQGITRHATTEEAGFTLSMKFFRLWMGFFLGMSVVGVLVMLSAALVSSGKPRPRGSVPH